MKAAFGVCCLILFTESACLRQIRRSDSKFIAGVPVLNYPLTYGQLTEGQAAPAEDWIVVVEPSTTDAQIDALCKRSPGHSCATLGHPGSGGVPFFEVRGTEADLEEVLKGAAGTAKFVEMNPRLNLIPDDIEELATTMRGDVLGSSSVPWHLERIGVPEADRTGKGVHVYIFDSGVRSTHVGFDGRAVPTLDVVASPNSPQECQGDALCALDMRGHGTHCAGSVGGRQHGVATDATLHAVKVLDDKGSAPWSYIISGLDWAARKSSRPAVASLSLGGPGQEAALETAVDVSVAAGITVMVAAGNAGQDACGTTPARVASAITVGALTKVNKQTYFTNYGSCTNIWAPGSNIISTSRTSDTATEEKSGTSMACPLVAGGVALLLEADPSLNPTQIRDQLLSNAINDLIPILKDGDVNKLLYVGAGGGGNLAPAPTPKPKSWFR